GRLRRGRCHRRATRSGPAAHTRRPAGPRRLRDEEARLECGRGSPRGLCAAPRNGVDAHYDESADARLGHLSRRRARRHRDSRSLPRPRHDYPDDREKLSPPSAREYGRRLRPWTLPAPWTPRTRPPRLGNRCAISTSVHRHPVLKKLKTKNDSRLRAGEQSDDTQTTYRVAAFQTFLSGRI